jgi:hypothetical protein
MNAEGIALSGGPDLPREGLIGAIADEHGDPPRFE